MEIKSAERNKNFFGMDLMNKVLTWDLLQKRNKHGLCMCFLCRNEDERISHLLIHCLYSQQVWIEVEFFTGTPNVWNLDLVEGCLSQLLSIPTLKNYKSLSCMFSLGIWLAHNSTIFEEKFIFPFQVIAQVKYMR
jgi:hypothetical protein